MKEIAESLGCLVWGAVMLLSLLVFKNWDLVNTAFQNWLRSF